MIPKRHTRYYAYVWPLFWPWLWLQLWRLERWQRESKRDLLIAVDRRGNVFIRAVADAKSPGAWHHEVPAVPVWERPALGSDVPAELLEADMPAPAPGDRAMPYAPPSSGAPLYLNFDTS